jgi:hypothetical protein
MPILIERKKKVKGRLTLKLSAGQEKPRDARHDPDDAVVTDLVSVHSEKLLEGSEVFPPPFR